MKDAPIKLRDASDRRGEAGEWMRTNLAETIIGIYLLIGGLWIIIGHTFVQQSWGLVFEDFIYSVCTAVIFYFILRRGLRVLHVKESALQESEDRLARILETNASGIVVCDNQDTITFANHAAERILGMERGSMVGLRNDDPAWGLTNLDGSPLPRERNPILQVKVTSMPVHDFQIGITRRDGDRIFLTINAAPLIDKSGMMAGIVASFADITEMKKAQELQLRKLRLAVEQSPSAIVITNPEGIVEYVNTRYTFMTGYGSREVLGKPLPCRADMEPSVTEEIFAALRAGHTWRGEFRGRRKNREPYWELTSVSPIRTQEGEITSLLWVRDDITERKQAEETLRRSGEELRAVQEKFRNLVESVSDWVWESDRNGAYTYVSPRVRDLLGYEAAEILGKTMFDLMPASEARRLAETFGPIFARREPFQGLENINRHRDGRFVVLETDGTPFFGAEGELLGYRGVARDIGERKRAEEMLRASEERFRQLFEQNEEPLFLFRADSAQIVDINPAAEKVYGRSRDDMIGAGLSLIVPKEELHGFEEAIASIRPESRLSIERVPHVRSDGSVMIVSVRGKSIRLENGNVSYCSIRDITARVRMEEEAKIQQARLIQANRMASLGTIVSGVAHEVNNPNNLIMFNAPMILAAWEDAVPLLEAHFRENGDFPLGGLPYSEMREVVPKLAAGISSASSRIKAIVSNLKDFTRQDRSNKFGRVQVNDVVHAAVAILNHEIIKATHWFEAEYQTLPDVTGSAQELEQVIINLLNNALQALPSNQCRLKVTTRRNPVTGEVEVEVADEGKGMSPEVLARIAEPFFSTRTDSGGLGLGLSISRSILKEHNGTLSFESEVGKGTRAIVRLPAADAGTPEGPAKTGPVASFGG